MIKSSDGFAVGKVQYKVEDGVLSFFSMKDEQENEPVDVSPISIKGSKFTFKTTGSGRIMGRYELKFIKVSM